ncbi:MAG: hypothetical protein J6V38_06395 [Kiritimatiellae bacterium]|jgi:hypothetical protein|nr:hypothetical protein [Kiritimatiellia bacterium]
MKMIFALFLAIILTGCTTVETCDVGGRRMVVVSNSGWYLFNLFPIASGNPEKVNKISSSFFSETATLENNYKILDDIIKSSGAKSVKSLKSFWNDESILVILMKRHVIHTTAELVIDEDGEKK